VLTATSLWVAAGAADDAVARARRLPSLAVGLHVVLVDGRPMLPPEEVPDLVDTNGVFRRDIGWSGANMMLRPRARRQLLREVEAQFEAFARTGLPLDHVNSHLHFHLHPTILGAILQAGRRYGMKAVRNPIEPRRILAEIEPGARKGLQYVDYVSGPWARLTRYRLRRAGVRTPDHVFGLHWTGAMTAPRLKGVIEHLPDGLNEVYLHPATGGGFEFAAEDSMYVEEAQALVDPGVIAAVKANGIVLGGFRDFV
jgi:hopanoid biosynthesis associated protein HpnK